MGQYPIHRPDEGEKYPEDVAVEEHAFGLGGNVQKPNIIICQISGVRQILERV